MMNPMRPRHAPYLVVAAAAAVALSLSGCGTTTNVNQDKPGSVTSAAKAVPTAKVLYDRMRKNVAAAESVHMKGELVDAGKTLTIDIAGDRAGKNTRAVVNDGTGEAELLTVDGTVYVKADAAYWTKNASAALAKVVAGKYVKIPAGTGTMGELNIGSLLKGVFAKDLPLAGVLQKVEVTSLDGVPAYLLTDKAGSDQGKIYVSADGKALLMRIVSTKKNPGTLDFTQWNAVAPFSAPPASQQVKIPGSS